MADLPILASVPNYFHELVVKASVNGVVLLKENRLTKRYTGNKYSAVDINGKLWLKASELKKAQAMDQKKTPYRNRGKKSRSLAHQQSENGQNYKDSSKEINTLPTEKEGLSTEKEGLSTFTRGYSVNKVEVRQRLLGYLNTMRGEKELYFWTVTFPAGTSDEKAYQIFNIWLTSLRQYRMLKEYLWIAERQPGTKTVHFHIAIPHKMPVQRANAMMRGTLKTFAKRGEIPYSIYQCNRYNGVDISKNRNTRRVTNFAIKKGSRALANYLTKYITKNDGTFSHLAWHNSRGYSSIFTGVTFTIPEFIGFGFNKLIDRGKRIEGEFFIFLPWANGPPRLLVDHLFKVNSYLQSCLN